MAFQKGQSGNTNGRPKGALNKRTRALRLLLEGEAKDLVRKAIEKAKDGDIQALRLRLERILPPVKDLPLRATLSEIGDKAESILKISGEIINAVTRGEITPSEGDAIMTMLEKYGRAIDLRDFEDRLNAVEEAIRKEAHP